MTNPTPAPEELDSIIVDLQFDTEHANHNQPTIDKIADKAKSQILAYVDKREREAYEKGKVDGSIK